MYSGELSRFARYSSDMSDIFHVIADATRRDILMALRPQSDEPYEVRVSDLVEKLGLSQPTVSKHLKVLRESEVVSVREEGASRFYSLNVEPLHAIEDFVLTLLNADIDTEITVEYLSENGLELVQADGCCCPDGCCAGADPQVLPAQTIHAAESVGRAAAKATAPVKELVARFKLRG